MHAMSAILSNQVLSLTRNDAYPPLQSTDNTRNQLRCSQRCEAISMSWNPATPQEIESTGLFAAAEAFTTNAQSKPCPKEIPDVQSKHGIL